VEGAFRFLDRSATTLRDLHTFNFRGKRGLLEALYAMQKCVFEEFHHSSHSRVLE
jgi:hypothetical protein